jgi:hypothetical protein
VIRDISGGLGLSVEQRSPEGHTQVRPELKLSGTDKLRHPLTHRGLAHAFFRGQVPNWKPQTSGYYNLI